MRLTKLCRIQSHSCRLPTRAPEKNTFRTNKFMFTHDVYAGDFRYELCNIGVPRNSRVLRS